MPYLFAAFCAVWLVLFLYLFSLSRRHRTLTREVEALRQMMERKDVAKSSHG
ncbi:MAG: CcmD family protein [Candidatus Binatia bacterium]